LLPLVEKTKFLTLEDIRKNYNTVYVSCRVSGWGSGRKEILELMAKIFLEFNLPSFYLWM